MVTDDSTSALIKTHPSVRDEMFSRLTVGQAERFWTKVQICGHGDDCTVCCWEWQGAKNRRGYGKYTANLHRRPTVFVSSRVAYLLTGGDLPVESYVCHACDNPPCCNPAHLWSGTGRDNAQDSLRKGRMATGARHWTKLTPGRQQGEDNGRATLTAGQVYDIRALQGHLTQTAIARAFGIRKGLVEKIHQRTLWTHLPASPGDQPGVRAREVPILRGEEHPWAQLTAEQVQAIRALQGTMTQAALGAQFGISAGAVGHILRRDTWADLPDTTDG